MKKGTSLLIGCSLVIASALFAQQPDEQQSPSKGNKKGAEKVHQATSETQPGEAKVNAKNRNHQETAGAQQPEQGQGQNRPNGRNNHPGRNNKANADAATSSQTNEGANANARVNGKAKTATETNASATESASPTAKQARQNRKNARGKDLTEKTAPKQTATESNAATTTNTKANAPAGQQNNVQTNSAVTNTNVAAGVNANANGGNRRVPQQQVQQVKQQATQIRQQHASFRAQPRPDRVQAVTFNQSYRIQGAEHWQGPQYEVYRSYHPQWHDQGWYHQHYQRVELIGGGYYYWNNGYWYPAWGYDSGNQYYAYDGPIYVGREVRPPDQVIADVQTELQQMGYYTGEVDGLLGPLTREALTAYQQDEGLAPTAAIDEPTLDSLGMAS